MLACDAQVHAPKMLRRGVFAAVVLLVTAGCGGSTPAASPPPPAEKLVVAFPSPTAQQAALAWAKAKGYFTAQGVDLQILIVTSPLVPVVAGQADIGQQGTTVPLSAVASGKSTSIIYDQNGNGFAAYMAALPSITKPSDCRTIVTNNAGTGAYAWAIYYQKAFGLSSQLITQGTQEAVAATLSSGRADCAVTAISAFDALIAAGKVKLVVDPRKKETLPNNFPTTIADGVYFGLTDNLKSKRKTVERFLAANQKGLKEVRAAAPEKVASTMRSQTEWETISQDTLVAQVKDVVPHLSPNDGYISPSTWPTQLQWLLEGGTKLDGGVNDPRWSYQSRVDMSYFESALGKPKAA
jgi:ABC-type nitrate/sulfonate/bicarbonate transport system substrate-binding protein